MQTTRKKITLPSGGTCVVRALSGFDYANMKRKPRAFPNPESISQIESGEREVTDAELESGAAFMEAILLNCVSPITYGETRRRIVVGKDLDQIGEDEILLQEIPQEDVSFIVSEVSGMSKMSKEAGEKARNFPEGQPANGDTAPAG